MNPTLQKVKEAGREAWLKFLSNVNKLVLVLCAGIAAFDQANHQMVADFFHQLTPAKQLLATLSFSVLMQMVIARIRKLPG